MESSLQRSGWSQAEYKTGENGGTQQDSMAMQSQMAFSQQGKGSAYPETNIESFAYTDMRRPDILSARRLFTLGSSV